MNTQQQTKKITLDFPVIIDGQETKEVFLRQPTVQDYRIMEKAGGSVIEKELAMFSNLLSIAPADLDKISGKDYKKITAAYQDFLV